PLVADLWRSLGIGKAGVERFTAKWNGWTFAGDAWRCWEIRGSFHKTRHGGTNWQDFTFSQLLESVATLCNAFDLRPDSLRLMNLEVGGVNIVPPIPTAEVLESIVLHRTQARVPMRTGSGIEIIHKDYRFKIYDKSRQYGLPGQLLRFEIAVKKMRTLERYGLRTVADLLDPLIWHRLAAFLLAKFHELLIVELAPPPDGLRPAQADLWRNATVPDYWITMEKQRRGELRNELQKLYDRHVQHPLKTTLGASIALKLAELMDHPGQDLCTNGTTRTALDGSRTFAPRVEVNGEPAQVISGQVP
ncbi:MAG: hypothetical protein KDB95_14385, partial [Flavobacteriales bacterium]|nr:hypothetical protein [Flavobacteriales bacterium]